jgi:hypothetical protein
MKWFLAIIPLLTVTVSYSQDRVQLKELRARFVNQKIIVNPTFIDTPSSFLADWQFVKEKKGRYEPNYSREVPTSYAGRTGTIVAVQAPKDPLESAPDQSDDAYVKYGEAIVQLDSGGLIQTALYPTYLVKEVGDDPGDAFILVSTREKHQQKAAALAQNLTGKSLYLTALTRVYDMGLKTTNIETLKAGIGYSEAEITHVPYLTPIPVLETRYSAEKDYTVVVLQLPDGRKALYVVGCIEDAPTPEMACASTSMPTFLSDREIEAIRKGSVFVGMSKAALYMAIGFPQTENKSLVDHTQLVYRTAYIYVDTDKKVVEIQSHD